MIDEWCQAVKSYLTTEFGDGAEVVDGEPKDRVWRDDKDLIAIWWPGWDEISRDIALAAPTLSLRYFPRRGKEPDEQAPASPRPIMQAADALLVAFPRTTQAPGFFIADLSCRLTTMRPNYAPDVWRVDATLLAYTLGAAA